MKTKFRMRMNCTLKVFVYSHILCVGFLQVGFGLGFPSPTLDKLRKLHLLEEWNFPIFASLFFAGMSISSFLSIPCSKYLGRKLVIILCSLSTILGLLLIVGATNAGYLFAGRLFHGIGCGFLTSVLPVYLGEISPAAARGFLSGFFGIYEIIGVLVVYIFGSLLSFRWLANVGIILALLNALAMLIVPQSATWLYSRGLEKRAKNILIGLRRKDENVLAECSSIEIALKEKDQTSMSILSYFKLFREKYRLKALIVGILLALGFVNSGVAVVLSYASILLGSSNGIDPNVVAIGVPILGIFGAILVIFLIETFGRKPLIITSAVVVTISLISITAFFQMDEYLFGCSIQGENASPVCNWIIFWPGLSLAVWRFGFQIGWGSIFFILMGEIFPIRIKELGSGISQCVLNLHTITILTVFPYVAGAIGNGNTFLIVVILNILSCIFVIFCVPETKRLKADEIEEIFQENSILCGLDRSYSYKL